MSSITPLAWGNATPWHKTPHGQVRIIAPYMTAPHDSTVYWGIEFQPSPGWVVYWKTAGDAGYPPKFDFKSSRGFANPEILWPRPKLFVLPGNIREYGYDQDVVYPIRAQRSGASGLQIVADINYLTCKESCVPYRFSLSLSIPAASKFQNDPPMEDLLHQFLKQVPPENEDILAELNTAPASPKLAGILLLAFVGGLILNIMPCVLPVLSIKLFGLLQHGGEERRVIVRDSLASAGGIIFSFLVGGGLLALAKRAGQAVGWGTQFQNPGFVAFLVVITGLFALNLWGVFEIPLPPALARIGAFHADDDGPLSFFLSGMFATLLATPCSAPFLGTAMGFALTQQTRVILLMFMVAGLGMATPYWLLALFPQTFYWLPKPGPWMQRVKVFLGCLLAGTALWLSWVFVQQVRPAKPSMTSAGAIPWIVFDESKIHSIVDSGKLVFVDVTADWCLTCKVNEKFVLQDADVIAEFKRRNIVMMRADWTNQDAAIGRYLAGNQRVGIPFYALYASGKPPVVLSELLTKAKILRALKELN
jgi:thiol:disulfide interchange protein